VCGLEKYGLAILSIILLLFELSLMEGIIVTGAAERSHAVRTHLRPRLLRACV
jgi:hypothetical protein